MKTFTKWTFNSETLETISCDWRPYDGPVDRCDRAAQNQANNAQATAGATAGTYETEGQAIQHQVTPWLTRRLTAEHSMSPDQLNQMLSYAGAGAGGATGAYTGENELEAARTRNTGGYQGSLDAMARQRQMSLAKASEGIGAEDVSGALQNQREAAGGLGEMASMDTGAALKAMGIQTGDINAEIEASKTGWFQNMTGLMSSLGQGAAGAGALLHG